MVTFVCELCDLGKPSAFVASWVSSSLWWRKTQVPIEMGGSAPVEEGV